MNEETATPYPLRTEDICDVVCEPTADYGKPIVYQGTTINKAIADYYTCNTNKDRIAILQWIVERTEFQELRRFSTNENAVYGLNISQYDDILLSGEMPNNLAIAQKLVTNKFDVFLLSNPNSTKSADFILRKRNCLYYVEGKTSTGGSSLSHRLEEGAKQADRIAINFFKYPKTQELIKFINTSFYSNTNLKELLLFKGSRLITVSRILFESTKFEDRFYKLWNKQK